MKLEGTTYTPLGIEVKKKLIDKDMTMQDLAQMLGMKNQYLSAIIRGEKSGKKYIPQIKTILGIAETED